MILRRAKAKLYVNGTLVLKAKYCKLVFYFIQEECVNELISNIMQQPLKIAISILINVV